jgi:hypothetical protein
MDRWAGVILGAIATVVYLVVGPSQVDTDSHWPIAQAFVAGRLHLVWAMLVRLDVARVPRYALTLSWAFGSEVLWVSGTGGQHLAPQVLAASLLLASIVLALDKRLPAVAGLLLGAGAASRLPVGLALPLLLYLYRGRHAAWRDLIAGVAVPALLVAAYNYARFGNPFEMGYGLIRNVEGESVLDEPWYPHGIDSVSYIPGGLYAMLFRGLEWSDDFPHLVPGWIGSSVLLTMPVLWWIFEARGRLALVGGITAALILLPDLAHGNPGWAQIGYRFIVDALPILWLMLGLAFRERVTRAGAVAMAAGAFVMIWLCGVVWLGFQE